MNIAKARKTNALSENTIMFEKIDLLTLDDVDHLDSERRYDCKHIAGVAMCLFKKHELKFEKQFKMAGSTTQLESLLDSKKVKNKTLFVAYRFDEAHWAIICVTHSRGGVVALYKDSLGGGIPSEIRATIEKYFVGSTARVNFKKEQENENSSGPMALRNMEIIMEELKINKELFLSGFEDASFCPATDLKTVKDTFKNLVDEDIFQTCNELVDEMAGKHEFKQAAAKLVDSCVDCIVLLKDIRQYGKNLRVEGEKQGESTDFNAIEDMKEKLTNHPQIKLWSKQAELAVKEKKEILAIKTEIEGKYEAEMLKFTKVFKLLGAAEEKSNSERKVKLRQSVCQKLGIDESQINKLHQTLVSTEADVETLSKKVKEAVEPINIDSIRQKLLAERDTNQHSNVNSKTKTVEQILAELAMENDLPHEAQLSDIQARVLYKEKYRGNKEIEKLEENYRTIKTYHDEWNEVSIEAIQEWVRENKGARNIDLCKAIAAMDRANELVTGGHRLRDTQILAVLDFLGTVDGQGKLCQIETGEGKTVIVSLLAAFKVLQGKQVDVITSNEILAEEGVRNRKYFFGVLGISVAHNNPDESYKRGPRKCYTADVVYGSMGSFQFDYLKDSFEGFGTRGKREFDFVILDEVDSLLLDNGGHIAKLAEPFPGFDSLKYVYVKIWQELLNAEKESVSKCQEELKKKEEELAKNDRSFCAEEIKDKYKRYRAELFQSQDDKLIEKIKESDPANMDLIPIHLRKYARDMVDEWIKNAIYAKYLCNENEQYVVRRLQDDEELKIVPVDYKSTGMTLKNTMWSGGLHQFVQLKHNLNLTSETLTSSLISNIGYVKLYKHNIFGLTGTLGSKAEQELLSEAYTLGYSKVPTFKPKIFNEIGGIVVKDDHFKVLIGQESLKQIVKRSVLIICNTISDVLGLEKKIKKMEHARPPIIRIYDEDRSGIFNKKIGVGEIIISTNIAGRGADFKTSPDLEANGGLHVLVCFLPANQRVEDQAFGRTSRQGNKGTAQIVVRESEVLGLGFEAGQDLTFKAIKERRDLLETTRLANILDVELVNIGFHDSIFSKFSSLYRQVMILEKKEPSVGFLLKDLKEFWAFWLHRKQKDKGISLDADKELTIFTGEASAILGDKRNGMFVGGKISHNPYYSIQQAEHFIRNHRLGRAEESLKQAIELGEKHPELLYTAYLKLFEVAVELGDTIMQRIFVVIKRVLPAGPSSNADEKEDYKEKAKCALVKAQEGLETEIEFIKTKFIIGASNGGESQGPDNQNFLHILAHDPENTMVKHIRSKLTILNTFLEHVKSLLAQIDESKKEKTCIALSSKIPNYWNSNKLTAEQETLRKQLGDDELRDLSLKGFGTMYAIQIVPSILEKKLSTPGLIQVGIGVSAFATGMAFPPSFPVMAKIAEAFVVEGLGDIVIAIITGCESTFNIKSKLLSYGTQALAIGIFALVKYTKIAQKLIDGFQRVITYLENCPNFKAVCQLVVDALKTIVSALENEIVAQSVKQAFKITGKSLSISTAKSAVSIIIENMVCEKNLDTIMNSFQPKIIELVGETVNGNVDKQLCKSASKETVLKFLEKVLEESPKDLLKDIANQILENFDNWSKSLNILELEPVLSESSVFTEDICLRLNEKLETEEDSFDGGNKVDEIFQVIGAKIAEHINVQVKHQVKKVKARATLAVSLGKLGVRVARAVV